jgi:hypothetical protein
MPISVFGQNQDFKVFPRSFLIGGLPEDRFGTLLSPFTDVERDGHDGKTTLARIAD